MPYNTAMITVHHLNNSRSQRVLWLLEELKLVFDRVANGPAPWPISAVARRIAATVQSSFIGPQLKRHLDYMEGELAAPSIAFTRATPTSARWNAAVPILSRQPQERRL
jgi:hypothetical protein